MLTPVSVVAQQCVATDLRHAVGIGQPAAGTLPTEAAEVYGAHPFYQEVGRGWYFALIPQPHGWAIRLYENAAIGDAVDLSEITPPHGGAPNPRDLFGWHFRNAANTGPNEGDVNAPQQLRRFFFSPALVGTGGFRPSTDPDAPRLSAPDPEDGIGWIEVLDYGLSDLEPGARARMTYLRFQGCITWPKTDEEIQREIDDASPEFRPEEFETYGTCGVDLSAYDLHAFILPRRQMGDVDGDDSFDEIAQIRRKRDGKRGLAVCRAGTWLSILGMSDEPTDELAGEALRPGFFDQMEAWRLVPSDHGAFGYVDEPEWPQSDGDILVLERIEKEMILLYWRDDALHSQQVYRFVEP